MSGDSIILGIFAGALAFLAGSVYYNRKTGWRKPARQEHFSSFLLWSRQLEVALNADLAYNTEVALPLPAARASKTTELFPTSLASLQNSLQSATAHFTSRPVSPIVETADPKTQPSTVSATQ